MTLWIIVSCNHLEIFKEPKRNNQSLKKIIKQFKNVKKKIKLL